MTSPPPIRIHSAIKSLEPFIGTWRGEGTGFYPTIHVFKYGEEVTFSTWGKPVVSYTHRTWNLESQVPMHYESGYLRMVPNGKIEFVNSQATGVTEIDEGVFNADKASIDVTSKTITRVPTAKQPYVTQIRRVFQIRDSDTLNIYFDMATTTQPLQRHLEAELKRVV